MNVNKYIARLKDQIEALKGEILFLTQELRDKNVPTKCKCIVLTEDDMELHNFNKSNNNTFTKNENNKNNIIKNLDNNPISNYNTNNNTEYTLHKK